MDVVIIAPHSKCYDGPRMCDTRALEIAENLYEKIQATGLRVKLFNAPEIRAIHDYNRDSSINTEFRQSIREYIKSIDNLPIIYEIHSFPDNTPEMNGHQMVIFDINEGYEAGCTLLRNLNHLKLDIVQIVGSRLCSLQREFIGMAYHHLLEFNEDYEKMTKKEADRITTALTRHCFNVQIIPECMHSKSIGYIVIIILILILLFFLFEFTKTQLISSDTL